ncbi:MAG: hypothetical protein QOH33_720, partial [Paraburkholderia sp.]|nr:hypothetical protein [Paraburkholderia sp.]
MQIFEGNYPFYGVLAKRVGTGFTRRCHTVNSDAELRRIAAPWRPLLPAAVEINLL